MVYKADLRSELVSQIDLMNSRTAILVAKIDRASNPLDVAHEPVLLIFSEMKLEGG